MKVNLILTFTLAALRREEEAPTLPPSMGGSARGRVRWTFVVLTCAMVLVVWAGLHVGPGRLDDLDLRATLLSLRGARLAGALLAGGGLAVGGVLVQAIFRNPLASPSILGTTAGASFGGQVVLLAQGALVGSTSQGWLPPDMLLPIGCVSGALASLSLLLLFVRRGVDLLGLLLTGFALTSLLLALGSFLTTMAQEHHELGRAVVSFTLGGLGGVGWSHVRLASPLVVAGLIAALCWGRSLDLLLTGDEEATSLGADVLATRRWTVVWVALLTAAAVALGGNIAFVGLVVPHAMRPLVGFETRRLIPASLLAGGVFLAFCDLLTRILPTRAEVPLGVVTGLVGAPLFIFLLARSRGSRDDSA